MWWIYKKDQQLYENMMRADGHEPSIVQEDGDKIQVNFTANVLTQWSMTGHWFG